MHLYLTADRIGIETGGGKVTHHELTALRTLGDVRVVQPTRDASDPFAQDGEILNFLGNKFYDPPETPSIAHVYAGCFSESCRFLRQRGWKVTYTVAAHDVRASRKAHEELGWPFDYRHLNDSDLFREYAEGYVEHADITIVPSPHSWEVVRSQGRKGKIKIIPHGADAPEAGYGPYKGSQFRVGYMGAIGADKGLITLFRAWQLAHPRMPKDSALLLAGRDTVSPAMLDIIAKAGCKAPLNLLGWVRSISDFHGSIDCYVQPSHSEGFGCEVLEAMVHGVPVLASEGAGASYLVPVECRFPAGDHEKLAAMLIAMAHSHKDSPARNPGRDLSRYTWESVRNRYVKVWEDLLLT